MISGVVAIVGRPNVGKSTLFNCLTKSTKALVDDQPGVTRDRIYGFSFFDAFEENGFVVVDTGGFETKGYEYQPFKKNIVWQQTEIAIEEADVVLLVFDAKTGLHPFDEELCKFLKKKNKRVIYVVNKLDKRDEDTAAIEFYQLGIESVMFTTASHNYGIDELKEKIQSEIEDIRPKSKTKHAKDAVQIAIIGRPNAGKSSLLNRLVGEERSLVSDVAGTTRDTVDAQMVYDGKTFVFIDTAGIRRRSKVKDKLESLSMMRSMRCIEDAHVVLLVLDAKEGWTDSEARLAQLATSQYKPLVIVVNKWDLIENKDSKSAQKFEEDIRYSLKLQSYVPVQYVSSLKNQRVHKLLGVCADMAEQNAKRATTGALNRALETMVREHTPAVIRKYSKRVKFFYATQVTTSPPTIVVFCNVANEIQESYKRYMLNRFRELLEFGSTPIRLIFRGKEEI